VTKQPRGTQRYHPTQRDDEDALTRAIVLLASQYGRYGYRRITALLQHAGWQVGKDRVERIWRREGLKVPKKQKPRGRLWLNDGSCVRLRPEHKNHVWSYDFVSGRTHDGRRVRMLNLIDEHTRESLLVRPERRWSAAKVIEALANVMVMKGVPEHIRSDNGPEFVAKDLRKWVADTGAKTLYIEPGSPWENGYCESFNSKLRDEFLNGEIFYSLKEVQVLAERWRVHYNTVRPHSSLGYRPPAPEAWQAEIKTGYGQVERLHYLSTKHRCSITELVDSSHYSECGNCGNWRSWILLKLKDGGSNSVVESQPSKLLVAGSIPVSRSRFQAVVVVLEESSI
jgi:putative transposase